MKNLLLGIIAIVILLYGAWFFVVRPNGPVRVSSTNPIPVLSYEDCVRAGYPTTERDPRQCKTPDGRTYAKVLLVKATYVNATADAITIENPFPGAVTGKTVAVIGKARGMWFFEASFPVELRDKDGKIIASGIAQAEGEWMTTEFVPYKAQLTAPSSYIGPATLVLKKDNPSGMPENDASMSVPITIEY